MSLLNDVRRIFPTTLRFRHTLLYPCLLGALLMSGKDSRAGNDPCRKERFRSIESLRVEMNADYKRDDDSLVLSNRSSVVRFYPGSRRLDFDSCTLWMNAPTVARNGNWEISERDYITGLRPLLNTNRYDPVKLRVLIDPGHGGLDGGAVSEGGLLVEKAIVLDIAGQLADILRERGMETRLTRERDVFVPLGDRAAMIKTWNADVFLSIHINSAGSPSAAGPETFILPANGFPSTEGQISSSTASCSGNTNNALDTLLAYSIQRRLPGRDPARDRGVRRARFQVLREAACPAVLIECGFVSNPEDARRLFRAEQRGKIAAEIAGGVVDYSERVSGLTADRLRSSF